jgi:hypothetical protein
MPTWPDMFWSRRELRAITRQVDWTSQKKLFNGLMSQQSR